MEEKVLTCIGCQRGCTLTVTTDENGTVLVAGNHCPWGADYGKKRGASAPAK